MPIISLTKKTHIIDKLGDRQKELFCVVPLLDGETVSGLLRERKLPFHQVTAASYGAANAFRYAFNGATVVVGMESKRLASREEVAFLERKFPLVFEVEVGLDERDPDDVAVDAQRERSAHEKERATLRAAAEDAQGKLVAERTRADAAERGVVAATKRAEIAGEELAKSKAELEKARDEIAALKEKLAAALSPVKSQGSTPELAEAVAKAKAAEADPTKRK